MSKKTYERLVKQLVKDVNAHPHKTELVQIMAEQLQEM